ncbi:MAG TPA: phosphate ABC transporter substrate-binding protein PstS [Burkholderiaceae bacterium]|nr:phosphate ABC transporter substrate-binding protein PstS [Burkholderiaceae bacterium]
MLQALLHRSHCKISKSFARLIAFACWLSVGIALTSRALAADPEVIGAGATFPAPAIEAWARQFSRESRVKLVYRSVGSAEGILRVTARSADFAMTDVPLTRAELAQDDLMQFPVIAGAIVPVVNIPGIGDNELRLSGQLLADLYLGKITTWDDPAIKALNSQLSLPHLPVRVVHRADGSGTSFVFTYYLSAVSTAWDEHLGIGSRLVWPVGSGAKGSEGVSEAVRDTAGAIGYVEYAYSLEHKLARVQLRNRSGRFVHASEAGVGAALASARWSRPGYYEVPVDREGNESWPIVGISFFLIHKSQEDSRVAVATLNFLHWIYAHGADLAHRLNYLPLGDPSLIRQIESSWDEIRDDRGNVLWRKGN